MIEWVKLISLPQSDTQHVCTYVKPSISRALMYGIEVVTYTCRHRFSLYTLPAFSSSSSSSTPPPLLSPPLLHYLVPKGRAHTPSWPDVARVSHGVLAGRRPLITELWQYILNHVSPSSFESCALHTLRARAIPQLSLTTSPLSRQVLLSTPSEKALSPKTEPSYPRPLADPKISSSGSSSQISSLACH